MSNDLPRLVLASGSPRRQELLDGLGVEFTVRAVELDESVLPDETPEQLVRRLSMEKARARVDAGELVLAADTIVIIDRTILGKPNSDNEARDMLRRLAGRRHTVLTGVALAQGDRAPSSQGIERSEVEIVRMSEEEIDWYVETGEPMDKAGSYAIQGLGALFVAGVQGNYTNVVGLPLPLTKALFRDLDFDLRQFRRSQNR